MSEFHHWSLAIRSLIRWAFGTSLVTYLGLFLIEDFAPGFVSLHFDLNQVLTLTFVSGVLILWLERERREAETHPPTKSQPWIPIIAIVAGVLVWYRIRQIGLVAAVIGLLSALVIFLLGRLLENEDDEPGQLT